MLCVHSNENNDKPQEDLELQRVNSENRVWRSACLRIDKSFAIFMVQHFVLVGLIIFFAYEMHISDTCESQNIYQSLLCMVLGLIAPRNVVRRLS